MLVVGRLKQEQLVLSEIGNSIRRGERPGDATANMISTC